MRRWRSVEAAALAAALATVAPPGAEAADPGGLVDAGLPPGAIETARSDLAFDRYALPVAPFGTEAPAVEPLEGRVIRTAFRLPPGTGSTAEVVAGYRARLAELGFAVIFECRTDACGGFDFRFGVELMPAPAMAMDTADFAQLSATAEAPGGPVHASILVSRVLGQIHGQTVVVLPAAPADIAPRDDAAPAASGANETAAAAPAPVAPDGAGAALAARLIADGHAVLSGLAFETGGATLAAGSEVTVETVAAMLRDNPTIRVTIVGHSDATGGLAANILLSRERARAVRAALLARGVAGDRVEAEGVGWLAPVASNATAEGRALNRRVELVLR